MNRKNSEINVFHTKININIFRPHFSYLTLTIKLDNGVP